MMDELTIEQAQKIFDEISAQITAARREEEEFLDLQITLANQEAEEKRVLADKEAAEKRIKSRLEMMEANEYQKKLKMFKRRAPSPRHITSKPPLATRHVRRHTAGARRCANYC